MCERERTCVGRETSAQTGSESMCEREREEGEREDLCRARDERPYRVRESESVCERERETECV